MGNDGPLDRCLALPAGSLFDDESSGNDEQHRSQTHDPEAPSSPDFLQQQIETERNDTSANSPGGQDYAISQTPFPDKVLCWNDRTGLRVFSSIPEVPNAFTHQVDHAKPQTDNQTCSDE
jgi:hypothetical protein